jgi:hypothetical protein
MVEHRRIGHADRRGAVNASSWWRGVTLAVIFCLGWSAIDQFQERPQLRGLIVFCLLLAASVVMGLGCLLSAQRARASEQTAEMITRVERQRGLGVVRE